ncbi:hypothetical protein A2U01_0108376 [Trifolium medium]|uniref:Uncharacterized protein n=1 Tax=Trifolium medium TaxID=97028 RepID=A0A392VJY0_9FABA|nr:hypothetical protein [Trifolium medium]
MREEWKKQQKAAKFLLSGAQGCSPGAQGAGFSTSFAVCCLFPAQRASRAVHCASFSGKCHF